MTLEKNIKQTKFRSNAHKLAVNILYTSLRLNYFTHSHFKNLDITPQQYNVLRILRGQYPGSCNLKLVKERMLDPMSDASRITSKLIQKGYVKREENKKDRRNVELIITEKGLALLQKMDFIDELFDEYFSGLTGDDINQLNKLLDKLHETNPGKLNKRQ